MDEIGELILVWSISAALMLAGIAVAQYAAS
jgi:hypothetical protein